VPVLGDIPVVGWLFRSTNTKKIRTNLLLFLTPYIVRDQADFRRIFERKMRERQQFVEQFYGAIPGYEVAVDFARKPGPLARLSQVIAREANKLENGGPGNAGEKLIAPGGAVLVPRVLEPGEAPPVPGEAPPPSGETPPGAEPAPVPQMEEVPIREPAPVERLEVQPGGEVR
jgi:general secretion pathway protein D